MLLNALLEQRSTDNAAQASTQLLSRLGVKVTARTVAEAVEAHPDHPSLLSISDSFTRWRVDNAALEVERENLGTLPVPFIAHQRLGLDSQFVVVTGVNTTRVRYLRRDGH